MANVEDKIKPELARFRDYLSSVRSELNIDRPIEWLDNLLEDTVPSSVNAYQNPRHYFPGLTDLPWHEALKHPTCQTLESHASQIAAEYFATGEGQQLNAYTQPDSSFIEGTEWRAAILKRWDQRQEEAAIYPKTFSILAHDPNVAEIIMFSVVQAGGKINPHCGPWNLRLTVHLGLKIPENTWIRVGAEKRSWEAGQCLVFDDSFEHEVANDSDKSRVILLVDLWHPDLTKDERLIIQPALMLLDDDYNDKFKADDAISFVAERLKEVA